MVCRARPPFLLRRAVLGVVLLLFSGRAAAQTCPGLGFASRAEFPRPSPYGGWAFLTADLNGDGRPDVISLDPTGILVSLNQGGGRFGPQTRAADAVDRAVEADFDGDGKTDLAVVRQSLLILLLGDGSGGFREAGTIFGTVYSVVKGDFNGDGRSDLAILIGEWPLGTLVVLLNQGQGRFLAQAPISVDVASSLGAADFNADGRTDLAVDQCMGVTAFLSNGDGTFSFGRTSGNAPACAWVQSHLDAGDLDRDGFPDLVQTLSYKNIGFGVRVLLGDGNGGFSPPLQYAFFDVLPGSARQVAIRDFDGDGLADVAVGANALVVVLRGDGKGALGPPTYFPAWSYGVFAADFDGDGRPDLLTSSGLLLTNTCRTGGFERVLAVPALVSTPGLAGASYESELTITNAGTTAANLELTYTATTGGGSGIAVTTIPPGAQVSDASAFRFLAGLGLDTGGPGPHIGTLRARFEGLSAPHAAGISVRVSSAGGGVAFSGVEPDPSATQTIGWLKEDAADRSNLALVNAGNAADGDIRLRVTLVTNIVLFFGPPIFSIPRRLALPELTLAPGEFRQLNRVLAASGLGAASAFATVERVAGSAPFLTWGVLNDAVTSDGSVVFPPSFDDPRRLTTVVETPAYDTEVVLTNVGSSNATVNLRYSVAVHGSDWSDVAITVPAAAVLRIPSFVDYLRQHGVSGLGSRGDTVTGTLDGYSLESEVQIGARISTSAPGGGRYGVFLPAVHSEGVTGPRTSAWIPDLRQDPSFRTNLVLVGGTFHVELFDASGRSVAVRDDVPSGQINSVLKFWAPGVTRAWARVTRTASSPEGGPFAAYAVINDGAAPGLGTGDGSIVWMEPDP